MAEKEIGRVKWFDDSKGFGFIERKDGGDVFVHYKAIESEGGRRTLRENDRVEFALEQGKKGWQAKNVIVLKDDE